MLPTIQEKKITQIGTVHLIGTPVTTTNEAEMKGEGVISAQWERFYKDRLLEKIPNKKNANILAIYLNSARVPPLLQVAG